MSEEATKRRGRAPRYAPESTIKVLADGSGNPYGKENNPKRKGTAAAKRFELYSDGMTVAAFLAAGGTNADLSNDVGHSYIEVVAA